MLHPDPQDIFIIGQGTGGTPIAAGVSAKTRDIRVVDMVAPVFNVMQQAALRSGGDAVHEPLREYYADPRYTRMVADARNVLLSDEFAMTLLRRTRSGRRQHWRGSYTPPIFFVWHFIG
jgi:spermidine synthase